MRTINNVALIVAMLLMVGCSKSNKITGGGSGDSEDSGAANLVILDCCHDHTDPTVYPSFVPVAHGNTCDTARATPLQGDNIYLAMSVDCERDHYVGSQYYKGHGY